MQAVYLTAPALFSVAGSPVTSTGTLALSLAVEAPNAVWAGPTTGTLAMAPTFRSLVATDIPSLAASVVTSGTFSIAQIPAIPATQLMGTLAVANGGTGVGYLDRLRKRCVV